MRSVARRWKAPPAVTESSWAESPTSSSFAPASVAWLAELVEGEGAGQGRFVEDDQLPWVHAPLLEFGPGLGDDAGRVAAAAAGDGGAV